MVPFSLAGVAGKATRFWLYHCKPWEFLWTISAVKIKTKWLLHACEKKVCRDNIWVSRHSNLWFLIFFNYYFLPCWKVIPNLCSIRKHPSWSTPMYKKTVAPLHLTWQHTLVSHNCPFWHVTLSPGPSPIAKWFINWRHVKRNRIKG